MSFDFSGITLGDEKQIAALMVDPWPTRFDEGEPVSIRKRCDGYSEAWRGGSSIRVRQEHVFPEHLG